eukprot:4637882-Pleurochrysis_carterae.AAC.1
MAPPTESGRTCALNDRMRGRQAADGAKAPPQDIWSQSFRRSGGSCSSRRLRGRRAPARHGRRASALAALGGRGCADKPYRRGEERRERHAAWARRL